MSRLATIAGLGKSAAYTRFAESNRLNTVNFGAGAVTAQYTYDSLLRLTGKGNAVAVYNAKDEASRVTLPSGGGYWDYTYTDDGQLAIGVLWLAGPFVPVIYAAIASAIFNMDFSQALKPFWIGIFSTSVQSAIWTGYLVKSVRVKNTYYP